ncbi:MAG: mechanosensitive ion channel family protein, partial [Oscillospiraceae bacterium]
MDWNAFAQSIKQWFVDKGFALAMAMALLVVGYLLSRILSAAAKRFTEHAHVSPALCGLLLPAVRWGTLLFAGFGAAGVVMTRVLDMSVEWFYAAALTIVRAVLLFAIGCAAIGLAVKALSRALAATKIDATLHPFLCSAAKVLLFIMLSVGCIDVLGIPTASVVAAMASVGLALSLSVKDHLSNLIGGVVILMTKPFVSGNYIEIDGVSGIVGEIGLIYTILHTFDNKKIFIPNNDAAKAKITNHSAEAERRLDLTFSIGYGDDYEQARALILETAQQTGLVLPAPAPMARMSGHGASAVSIVCRLWVRWE